MPSDARPSPLAVPPPVTVATPEPASADAGWLAEAADFGLETPIDLDAELNSERASPKPDAPERDVFELDISGELEDLLSLTREPHPSADAPAPAAPAPDPAPVPAAPAPAPPGDPRGLEGYFEGLREHRGRDAEGVSSALAYDQASEYFNSGELDSAVECLRTAARDPLIRFRAASMLARIARDRNRLGEAVEWLERASEAPAPSVEASHGLLYELGDALQSEGEDARALAVFLELQSSAPGYRDVGARIANLSARDRDRPGPRKGLP
jgi:tetratricopeptide (TPR) repeat protein